MATHSDQSEGDTLTATGSTEAILAVTDAALAVVGEARAAETDPTSLALFLEVSGTVGGAYSYDMWFQAEADATGDDVIERHGDLAVVIAARSVPLVLGATLDHGATGLVIVNPNVPEAARTTEAVVPTSDLSSPLEQAVLAILENEINPQIASHGGRADLMAVDDDGVAFLVLSGGCQGCGMAQVTLREGIVVAIREAIPEITDVVDVTAHAAGANPYYATGV